MADGDEQDIEQANGGQAGAQQVQGVVDSFLGGGSPNPRTDVRMGMNLIALASQNTAEIGSGGEATRMEGAAALYDNLEAAAIVTLTKKNEAAGVDTPPTPTDIQAEMIARVEREFVSLSHGKPLTQGTKDQVSGLLSGGKEGFVEKIVENAAELNSTRQEHLDKVVAANQHNQDNPNNKKPIPKYEHVGIMAALTKPDIKMENGERTVVRESELGDVDASGVDVSPQAQLSGALDNAFDGMSAIMFMHNGAETHLAQIHGASWGEFTDGFTNEANRNSFEGLNRFQGPGNQITEKYEAWVEKFTGEGLGGKHAVVTDGPEVDMTAQALFTQPMIEQGLLKVAGTPEQQAAALEAWNDGLREGFMKKLSGEDLKEHMADVASQTEGLTLGDGSTFRAGEPVVHHDGLDRAREIVAAQEAAGVDMRVGSADWEARREQVLAQEEEARQAQAQAQGGQAQQAQGNQAQGGQAQAQAGQAQAGEEQAQADTGQNTEELASANVNLEESQALMQQFDAAGFEARRETFVPDEGNAARLGMDNVDSSMPQVQVVAGMQREAQNNFGMGMSQQDMTQAQTGPNIPQQDMSLQQPTGAA